MPIISIKEMISRAYKQFQCLKKDDMRQDTWIAQLIATQAEAWNHTKKPVETTAYHRTDPTDSPQHPQSTEQNNFAPTVITRLGTDIHGRFSYGMQPKSGAWKGMPRRGRAKIHTSPPYAYAHLPLDQPVRRMWKTNSYCRSRTRHFYPIHRLRYLCDKVPGSCNKATGHTRYSTALRHGVLQWMVQSMRNNRILSFWDSLWALYGRNI